MTKADLPPGVADAIGALASGDRASQGASYELLRDATAARVDWGDAAWERMEPLLRHRDNRVRSIAGQALCVLARSTSPARVARDLDAVIGVTRDERFVTTRHVLLALWKVGLDDAGLRSRLLDSLAARFASAAEEKNGTLVRYDIACALRSLFDATGDEAVRTAAMALIPTEQDDGYRKKYASAWRGT